MAVVALANAAWMPAVLAWPPHEIAEIVFGVGFAAVGAFTAMGPMLILIGLGYGFFPWDFFVGGLGPDEYVVAAVLVVGLCAGGISVVRASPRAAAVFLGATGLIQAIWVYTNATTDQAQFVPGNVLFTVGLLILASALWRSAGAAKAIDPAATPA
jgi:hypothetical protein